MTDLEQVSRHLEAVKGCTAAEIPTHLSPALGQFRFIPRTERRACADGFFLWVDEHGAAAPVTRAYALFLQAVDRFINEEHEASLQLVTRARVTFTDLDDQDGMGLAAMLIGAIYRTFGNFDLALKVLWEGYELLRASGRYPVYLAAAANTMANIDLDLGHLEDAMTMFNVAYEASRRADDFYFNIYALHGMGRVYMHLGEHAKAAEMFERALRVAEQHEHPLHIANSLTEFAALHFQTGNLDAAEALSARALTIRERHRLLGGAVTNCIRLGEIHCRRTNHAAALPVLTHALAIAEELKVKPKIAQAHLMLSQLHEQMHDPEQSLYHYKRFHEAREAVEREDSARKLSDARLIFEAEQTRKENVVIKEQKAAIQRQNRELQDTIDELTRAKIGRKAKAMTLGVAVVLFIFQDAMLRTALRLLASDNYFLLLGVKMAIIFSLSPINKAIERHLLRQVIRRRRTEAALMADVGHSLTAEG